MPNLKEVQGLYNIKPKKKCTYRHTEIIATKDGVFIGKYHGLVKAAKELGLTRSNAYSVIDAVGKNGVPNTAKGYVLTRGKVITKQKVVENIRKVLFRNLDTGKEITFSNAEEASEALGVSKNTVIHCIYRNHKNPDRDVKTHMHFEYV